MSWSGLFLEFDTDICWLWGRCSCHCEVLTVLKGVYLHPCFELLGNSEDFNLHSEESARWFCRLKVKKVEEKNNLCQSWLEQFLLKEVNKSPTEMTNYICLLNHVGLVSKENALWNYLKKTLCPEKESGSGRELLHQCLCADVLYRVHHPKNYALLLPRSLSHIHLIRFLSSLPVKGLDGKVLRNNRTL